MKAMAKSPGRVVIFFMTESNAKQERSSLFMVPDRAGFLTAATERLAEPAEGRACVGSQAEGQSIVVVTSRWQERKARTHHVCSQEAGDHAAHISSASSHLN